MPAADVSRSDSNRSDASQKPRVSFNRDVHIKRIVPHESERVSRAVNGTDAGTPVTSPVRKERLKRTKKELAEEAAKVLRQADKVQCFVDSKGSNGPERFFSLPHRKKSKLAAKDYPTNSLDRGSIKRRGSLDLQPPKKPPRTFASTTNGSSKPSIFDLFKRSEKKPEAKKSNLRRSVSDASALRYKVIGTPEAARRSSKKSASDNEDGVRKSTTKKQLSPIIEVAQREDYFLPADESENKENNNVNVQKKPGESVTDQLKEYIDEVDEQLYKETGIRISSTPSPQKEPTPVIIDVDKAEKISDGKKSKLHFGLGKKFKALTGKKSKTDDLPSKTTGNRNGSSSTLPRSKTKTSVKKDEVNVSSPSVETINEELSKPSAKSSNMIHSSQKPVDRPPLTKGRTVNTMVKRLSNDSGSSPPPMRTHVLISPNLSVQHNGNQPFSYTRGISPDKCLSNENLHATTKVTKPVIYAQVVCGNNGEGVGNGKQTVHAAFTNGRRQPQSDSDEGLGGEESSGFTRKLSTHFGDDSFDSYTEQLLDEIDKYKAESPILPKYRSPGPMNGFSGMTERGRADGMDSKRRESFTEPENELSASRTDLAARRNLLESRMNRRMNDKNATPSPEHPMPKPGTNNVYITESSSRYYRSGSTSPVGFKEKYVSTSRTDKYGEQRTESRTKKYFGEPQESMSNGFDSEPKSFDSQTSDYRSYPSEKPLSKDRDVYKSTPEIRHLEARNVSDAFHASLPRGEKIQSHTASRKYRSDRHLDLVDERKVESARTSRTSKSRRDVYNDSEDEGFASSLLIASEKQHTDDSLARKNRRNFERTYNKDDEPSSRLGDSSRYIPRERSIDDGSHFDPRLDKDLDRSTLKRVEKKPPKPEKKSGLEKVKSLFMRDSKKKKEKVVNVKESKSRTSSYKYDGKDEVDGKINSSPDYKNRRRLSTPSPSPTRETVKKTTSELNHSNWFKSLERIGRRKSSKDDKDANYTSTEEETIVPHNKLSASNKNLRFFGDTDQESNGDSLRGLRPQQKSRPGLRAQSTRDLHNISEEVQRNTKRPETHHKSLTNIAEPDRDLKGSRSSLKPPMSPSARYRREERPRRRRQEISSVESSTEGDSSQQSQRSIVYLHAAAVGDIPGPDYLRNGRRAASREDLTSNGGSSLVQPQVKTLSRSFSVLAPWRPRHRREGMELDYTPQPPRSTRSGKYEQKTSRSAPQRNETSTLKRKAQEGKKLNTNRRSRSRENVSSREDAVRGSTSTLYKKKDKLPRENSRYKEREERRMPAKSQSVESISRRSREDGRDVSRSVSMPRDAAKAAGWFRKSKKTTRE